MTSDIFLLVENGTEYVMNKVTPKNIIIIIRFWNYAVFFNNWLTQKNIIQSL